MKYIRNAVEVEAFKYDGDFKGVQGYYVPDWAVTALNNGILFYGDYDTDGYYPWELCLITTGGEIHVVDVGDYIIRDSNGNIASCKAEFFEQTYEPTA